MKDSKKIDLGLSGYNDLFKGDIPKDPIKKTKVLEIPLHLIDDAPNHPFKVNVDEDMYKLVESIKANGIIIPAILRCKENGRYELVSGHRRKKACELAGIETLKAEVRRLSYDEAVVMMVESNFQRTKLLPSELAYSYRMRMEALKRQGKRSDITSTPVVSKSTTAEEVGKINNDSREQVRRYIRLTELVRELLDMVDQEKIGFRPAVELSYLSREEQMLLYDAIKCEEATPSLAQAIKMKKISKEGKLDTDKIFEIMCERKPNQAEKIIFKATVLRPHIPHSVTTLKDTEEYIIKALTYYNEHLKGTK